jgi:4'-phosphopantetheinyl transferase
MQWTDPPGTPALAPDEAHVWRIDLRREPAQLERDLALLSERERLRAERFRFAIHRDRYVAAHAALRSILGSYLGLAPEEIRYVVGPAGKPSLAPGVSELDLRFNLSDSGDLALCAVSEARELGVDLERLRRDAPVLALAERWLAPPEAAALRAISEAHRAAAFFACWTRKEAYVKARGGSIIRSLRTFAVTVEPGAARVELHVHDDPAAAGRWWLGELDVDPGFAAALAAEGEVRLRRYRWS